MLVWALWKAIGRLDWRYAAVLVGYGAGYLPWFTNLDRQMYFFYATPLAPFLIIGITLVLGDILGRANVGVERRLTSIAIVAIYVGLVVANFIWLWPILNGDPITHDAADHGDLAAVLGVIHGRRERQSVRQRGLQRRGDAEPLGQPAGVIRSVRVPVVVEVDMHLRHAGHLGPVGHPTCPPVDALIGIAADVELLVAVQPDIHQLGCHLVHPGEAARGVRHDQGDPELAAQLREVAGARRSRAAPRPHAGSGRRRRSAR